MAVQGHLLSLLWAQLLSNTLRVSHGSQRLIMCVYATQGCPGRIGKAWSICLNQMFLCRVRLAPWAVMTGEREADHASLVSSWVQRESVGIYILSSAFLVPNLPPAEPCAQPEGHCLEWLLSALTCPLYWQLVLLYFPLWDCHSRHLIHTH